MLSTSADDRVFYAIYQDGDFLSGYEDLRFANTPQSDSKSFQTGQVRGAIVRQISANRTVGFFALAAALSYFATAATLGQLNKLTNSVTRRGPQDLSPFNNPVPREMAPLVKSLNFLMGRLDHSLNQSEDFIAEAAHRVRTPLATVRSYAEATLQRVDKEENREAMRSMVKAIDESSRAAGQLLDHAMITFRADHLEREDIDLVELVRDLVLRLTPIAEMKDLSLSIHGDPKVRYDGDPIPHPAVTVSDHGPGFPAQEIDTLTARFQRGQNAKNMIGSGLGLTIAQDVAAAHGGTIELINQPEGGACVTILL